MGSVRISTSIANAIAAISAATSKKPTPVLLNEMSRGGIIPDPHDRLARADARWPCRTNGRVTRVTPDQTLPSVMTFGSGRW
ncbi:hypothetical protein GCM10009541_13110 [Micromonospora gifhornensis]|uniref:Uncharacterized protein n=1 Tax=Micromonospora gifhornensis TaxID=84594 RepID=A0ABQ4IIF1_9ACTN|nr:hypothetical protein Vgi01_43620 [Micromonospora gifhornensis]